MLLSALAVAAAALVGTAAAGQLHEPVAPVGLWPSADAPAACDAYASTLRDLAIPFRVHFPDDVATVVRAVRDPGADKPFSLVVVCKDETLSDFARSALDSYEALFGVRRVAFDVAPDYLHGSYRPMPRPSTDGPGDSDDEQDGPVVHIQLSDAGESFALASGLPEELSVWSTRDPAFRAATLVPIENVVPIAHCVGNDKLVTAVIVAFDAETPALRTREELVAAGVILQARKPVVRNREVLGFFYHLGYDYSEPRVIDILWVHWGLRYMSADIGISEFRVQQTHSEVEPAEFDLTSPVEYEAEWLVKREDIEWYKENYRPEEHRTYVTIDNPDDPIAVSIMTDQEGFKVFVRSIEGTKRIIIPAGEIVTGRDEEVLERLVNRPMSSWRYCVDPQLPVDLLKLDETMVVPLKTFRFGVGYLGRGQSTETQMYHNVETTQDFKQFLEFLGTITPLMGWDKYRADLDVKRDLTGTHSVYEEYRGNQIMFHVSTMLPFDEDKELQINRKRFIGHDRVIILFQSDPSVPFQLQTIVSRPNHVIFLVSPHEDGYNVVVASKAMPRMYPLNHFKCNEVGKALFLNELIKAQLNTDQSVYYREVYKNSRKASLASLTNKYGAQGFQMSSFWFHLMKKVSMPWWLAK